MILDVAQSLLHGLTKTAALGVDAYALVWWSLLSVCIKGSSRGRHTGPAWLLCRMIRPGKADGGRELQDVCILLLCMNLVAR